MLNIATQALWLALNIYHEARGESEAGQVAVCHVVLNRVYEDKATPESVIKAKSQFSWTEDGLSDAVTDFHAFAQCMVSVMKCLDQRAGGYTLLGANHYFNPDKVLPSWAEDMTAIAEIGGHKFLYGSRGRGSGLKGYR